MDTPTAKMLKYRRYFHQFPELAFKEYKTSTYIFNILCQYSCFVLKRNVGGTGIIATFTKFYSKSYVAFRADMDALPIQEETNLEFRSRTKGISHSCGHDLHMSCLLTFAEYIFNHQHLINCNVKLIFQPAEELDQGALAMIKEGTLDDIKSIYGFHVFNNYPLGKVVAPIGVVMGATHELNIKIKGVSGHGAEPFKANDPITQSAIIIQQLLRIKSHKITSYEPSALTICSIHGGTAFNVIPEEVHLRGSIRTVSTEVLKQYKVEINNICNVNDFDISYTIKQTSPYTINSRDETLKIRKAIKKIDNIEIEENYQTLLGEDFSYFLEKVPGCYILVGSALENGISPPHHSSKFNCNENVMPIIFNILKNMVTDNSDNYIVNRTKYLHRIIPTQFKNTPQYYSDMLSKELQLKLLLKLEIQNPVRSFKARGAYAFLNDLKDKSMQLVTASVGNFGQGMLYACRDKGYNLIVFASENANPNKISRMQHFCENTNNSIKLTGIDFDAAKISAIQYAKDNNFFFVEDGKIDAISEGAGTIAYELPLDLDAVFVPIGNGALIIGVTKYIKQVNPNIKVIGVCAAGAPCMKLSYDQKKCVETKTIDTIADGVGVRVPIFSAVEIINQIVDDIILIEEEDIIYWMTTLKNTEGLIVEGAGAITVAAINREKEKWKNKKVCALVCGGNAFF